MASFSIQPAALVNATPQEFLPIAFPVALRKTVAQASGASRWALCRSRRLMDMTLAAIALLMCLPMMTVVAVAIRLDSEGPVFFRQKRIGRNGKKFTLLKFRSMQVSMRPKSSITVAGDSRITRVGHFLRRVKFDELPQFWNVLRGDMSLVGPRPKLAHLEPLLMTYRPGITGFATLVFRCEESLLADVPKSALDAFYHTFVKPGKAQLDREYMENATLLSDLRILLKTATGWMQEPGHPILDRIELQAILMRRRSQAEDAYLVH